MNITMPWEERKAAGIEPDYDQQDHTRELAYRAFEGYMARRINEAVTDASSVLVMCGSRHVEGLSVLLSEAGHNVSSESVVDRFSPPMEKVEGEYLGNWKDL